MVAKHCFKVGMYWQGLTHDLSKYSPSSSGRDASITRDIEVQTMRNARTKDILLRGCIIRDATSTTMSTGSITVWDRSKEWQA